MRTLAAAALLSLAACQKTTKEEAPVPMSKPATAPARAEATAEIATATFATG